MRSLMLDTTSYKIRASYELTKQTEHWMRLIAGEAQIMGTLILDSGMAEVRCCYWYGESYEVESPKARNGDLYLDEMGEIAVARWRPSIPPPAGLMAIADVSREIA